MLPSDAVTTGPSARLLENVIKVSSAGNTSPTAAKIGTALQTMVSPCSRNGEASRKHSVNDGMLIAAPDRGWMCRSPNCVSTRPPPRKIVAVMASRMAVMGFERLRGV